MQDESLSKSNEARRGRKPLDCRPAPVSRNWQTQRIQNPPPPKGLQVRFLSPASQATRPADDAPRPAGDAREADTPLPEPGSRLVLRAGRLMRDPQAGSWRFVPEQTTGKGDRSLEILPCLMLERLERMAREGESSPKILLSGTVIVFEGNAYLLPTNFRKSREGRGLGR